jgi:hypothetical protein
MAQKFTITAELNLQTKNIGQVVDNLKKQFQGADLNIKIKDLAKAESQMRGLSKTTGEAERSVSSLGGSIATAAKKFSAITLATGTLIGFTRAIKNAVSDAIEFEREIVKIAQATGKTVGQLKSLQNEVSFVASSLGVSSKELILAARSLTQAGFAADKVTGALRVLAQTEVAATFDSIADTTEGAIALLNQFGRAAQRTGSEVEFLERSLSAINQVSKDFAVESSDLITAVRTTGSAFESAGGSLNELLALFTSVRSTTRESAESIATGFRTIFTRVQRVDTINALRNLGIELQDVEGKFVGPMEATKRLSTALSTIDPRDFRFNLIVEELGGFRQVSKVIPLIQQFAVAQKALNVAQNSSGSLAKDAATAQQALSVQIAKTKENFQAFVRELVDSSSFQNTVKSLLSLADSFIRVADTIKPLIPLIAGFAAIKVGQALGSSFLSATGGRNKKAQGGKIHAFASGGLVPGQGNGDTVPAMLTPGEFVIRKSSVKKLGVDSLAHANKYASGGAVQFYTKAGNVKKNDKSRQNTVVPQPQELDTLKFTNTPKSMGGLPSKTKVLNSKGVDIGPADDSFNVTVNRKIVKVSKSDAESYGIAEAGGKGTSGRGFEKYLSDKFGYELLNEDKQFPFDLKTSTAYADAKDLATSSVKSEAGYKKAVNFLMLKSLPGYQYKSVNKQTVSINDEKAALAFGSGNLTSGKDSINFPAEVDLIFPEKLNKREAKKKALGGLIQRFALGGPAGKSRAARAITIPRIDSYTFNKPSGADLDSTNSKKQQYKLNAEDRLDYDVDNINVDVSKLKVSKDLLEQYNTADAQKRGYRFEDILKETGMAKSLSQVSNARLDGITAAGDPFEAKSRKSAIGASELEDKLYGGISDSISDPEKLARARFNANDLTENEDHIKIGRVTVFEDVTRGLGAAVNTKARMGYAEEEAAKEAKEQSKMAAVNAQERLRSLIDKNFNSGYKIFGTQYAPIKENVMHRDVASLLNKKLGGRYQDKLSGMSDEQVIEALDGVIVRRAMGGGNLGTDTVPAMLTPGEYVINKKSAQAIGSSTLNRMNKVGKFANGGPVGVQSFADGGDVVARTVQTARLNKFLSGSGKSALSTVDPKEAIKVIEVLRKIAESGRDIPKALKYVEEQIKQQGANFKLDYKGLSQAVKAPKETPSIKLSDQLKDLTDNTGKSSTNLLLMASVAETAVAQLAGFSDETKNALTAFGATFATYKLIGDNLKNLGTDIYISKLKRQEETNAINKSTNAHLQHAATIKGQNLSNSGNSSGISSLVTFEKVLNIADGAVTGFSTAMAAAAAYTQYYSTIAEKAGKELDKTIEDFKKNPQAIAKNTLTEKYQKTLENSARASLATSSVNSKSGMSQIIGMAGSGAAIGAALGSAIAPGVGTAIGASLGGVTGGLGAVADILYQSEKDLQKSFKNISNISSSLGNSLYTSVNGIKNAQKFIQDIEKKTNEEVSTGVTDITTQYTSSGRSANIAEQEAVNMFGSLEKVPEAFKKSVDAARDSAESFGKELDNIIAAQYSRKVKEIDVKLNDKKYNPLEDIQKFTQSQIQNISDKKRIESETLYGSKVQFLKMGGGATTQAGIEASRKEGLKIEQQAMILSVLQTEKALNEMEKSLIEDTLQLIKQKEALMAEDERRQKLIGTINEQIALESALKNFEYSIKKADARLSQIGANFGGSVSGLKPSTPDSSILDSIIPNASNMADYQSALKVIAGIGPAGQKIASNFQDLNKVLPNFKAKMAESSGFVTGMKDDVIQKFVAGLGIDTNGEVGKQIQKMIAEAVAPEKGGGPKNPAEIQKRIGEELDKYAEMLRGSGKRILDAITANEQSTAKAYDEINASRQRQLDLQMQSIDGYEKLVKNVAAAQGRTLSLIEKNNLRFNRQKMLAGNMAGNPAGIGKRLGEIRGKLGPENVGNLNADQRASLQNEAGKLTQALKELADQSGRTADTLEEIEKIKAQREAVKDAAKEYTFGGVEERAKLEQSVQALSQVMATGNIDSIPDELKSGVQSLLDRFKDVPMFNGMTGKQVENKLIANKMRDIGAFDAANMIEADTSTPEQKLTQELYRIAAEEQAARQQLFNQEAQQQAMQMDVVNKNTLALQQLSIDLQAEKKKLDQQGQAGVDELGAKKDKERLAEEKKKLEDRKKFLDDEIKVLDETMVELNSVMAKSIANLQKTIKDAEATANQTKDMGILRFILGVPPAAPAQGAAAKPKAQGGLIYAAKGQLVNFQPKGTDTVPAMLTPGEFVMKRAAVQKYGGGMMKAINAGEFAKGGTVGYYAGGDSVGLGAPQYDFNPAKQQSSMTEQTKLLSFLVRLKDISNTNILIGGSNSLLTEIRDILKGLELNNKSNNIKMYAPRPESREPRNGLTFNDVHRIIKNMGDKRAERMQAQQQILAQVDTKTGFDTSGTAPLPSPIGPRQMAIRARSIKRSQANQSQNPAKKTKRGKSTKDQPTSTLVDEDFFTTFPDAPKPLPPAPPIERDAQGRKVRPKNSMYTQEQWDAMQKKADDEKKLSDARAKALEEEIARDIADNGKRASGVRTVDPRNQKMSPRDRIAKLYGKNGQRPKIFPTDEAWYRDIQKRQKEEDSASVQDLTKRSQKSNEKRGTSDYGKPSALPPGRSQATQDAIDKAKELQKSADALRKRQTGLNPGERYNKPSDVPVLTPSKHGTVKPMTPAELDAMEKEAEKAVFTQEELLATQDKALRKMKEDANKVHRNMKKQYEGKDAYSRYLNALGKLNAANMMRNKYKSKPAGQDLQDMLKRIAENAFKPKPTAEETMPNGLDAFQPLPKEIPMPNGLDAFQPMPPEPQTPPASPFVEKPKELLDQEKKTAEEAKKALEEAKKKVQAAAAAAKAQEEARKNQEKAAKEAQDNQKKAEETARRKAELDKAAQKAREDELKAEKSFVGPPESYTQKKVEPPKEEPFPTFEEWMKVPARQQLLGPKNGPLYEYNLKIAKDDYANYKAKDDKMRAAKAAEAKRKQEEEAAAKKEADRQKALNDPTEEDARKQNALDKQTSDERNKKALLPPVRPLPTPEPPRQSTAPSVPASSAPPASSTPPSIQDRAAEMALPPDRQEVVDIITNAGYVTYAAGIDKPGGATWKDAFRVAENLKRDKDYYKKSSNFKDQLKKQKSDINASPPRPITPLSLSSGGFINYLARGGSPIFKPQGTDTVPAMLSPGEYVIRKSAVDKIGIDALQSINSTGKPRGGAIPKKNEVKVNRPVKEKKSKPVGMLQGAQKHPGGMGGFGIGPMGGGGYGGMGMGGGFGGFGGYGYGAPLVSYNTYNGQPFGSLGMQEAQNWYMGQYYQNFVQKPNMIARGNSNIMNSLMGNYMNNYSQGRNSFLQKMLDRSMTHMDWERNFSRGGKVNYRAVGGKMSGTMGIGGYAGVDDMIGTGLGNLSVPFSGGFGYGTPLVRYDTYNGQPFGSLSMQEAQNWYMGQYNQNFVQKPAMMAQANNNAFSRMQSNYMNNYAQGHNDYMSNIWANGGLGGGFTHFKPYHGKSKNGQFDGPGVDNVGGGRFAGQPRAKAKATGGPVYRAGGGSAGKDTVPAMLTPGEFVMNKNAVDKHGMNFMDHLNRGGKVQGFATGGPVYRAVGGSMGGNSGGVSMSNVGVSIDLSAISTTISNSIGAAFSKVGSLINPSAVTQIVSSFSSFIQSMNNMLSKVSGMQMTHTVNISGGISVTGINSQQIANVVSGAVTEEVANLVRSEVMRQFNQIMNQAKSE